MDPIPPQYETPPPAKPRFPFVFLLPTIMFFVSTLFFGYQNIQLKKQVTKLTTVAPTSQPTPLPTPINKYQISNHPTKSDWKLAQGMYFSIAYPSDWYFESPIWSDTKFSETLSITSPSRLSSVQIGTKYSFPFGGPLGLVAQQKQTQVAIGNKIYPGEETSYGISNNDLYSNFTMVTLTDNNIQLINHNNKTETEPILILFGNDYPLSPRNQNTTDQPSNYRQYVNEKPVLLQILSTFQFTQ